MEEQCLLRKPSFSSSLEEDSVVSGSLATVFTGIVWTSSLSRFSALATSLAALFFKLSSASAFSLAAFTNLTTLPTAASSLKNSDRRLTRSMAASRKGRGPFFARSDAKTSSSASTVEAGIGEEEAGASCCCISSSISEITAMAAVIKGRRMSRESTGR